MENQAFYDDLLNQVKDSLKYEEVQELKSINKENIPLLEEKIQKLKGSIRFVRISVIAILILIILAASVIQIALTPKLNRFLILFMMIFPISVANAVIGSNSLPSLQKRIDNFELMLILTKGEWQLEG